MKIDRQNLLQTIAVVAALFALEALLAIVVATNPAGGVDLFPMGILYMSLMGIGFLVLLAGMVWRSKSGSVYYTPLIIGTVGCLMLYVANSTQPNWLLVIVDLVVFIALLVLKSTTRK